MPLSLEDLLAKLGYELEEYLQITEEYPKELPPDD